ncbi:unnamed protein product [Schistocephalus solidus]|uniref:Fibronectin type-III domain-containing protein n=1 Tax=Schistocephalus solidus TaxID=70667 RepID=A0A183T5E9_SCHSO|nr:unnamed protein product [Schistocephalus solidus]
MIIILTNETISTEMGEGASGWHGRSPQFLAAPKLATTPPCAIGMQPEKRLPCPDVAPMLVQRIYPVARLGDTTYTALFLPGFVGKRHRSPSFEVTERTDTCIDVQWDKHYFKTTGLRHFILRAIAMGDKKSVEYRFAAVARDGYLCELEPNTKYTISLIPVTISGTTPETFDLHNVLTLPAVSSLAMRYLGDSVHISAEAEITDSTEGTGGVSTQGIKTATVSNSPSLFENITGAIPTVPSESNEKGFVGKRHRSPSFEVTERTDTCIDVQWDKHYFKTTGLRHFILRAIAMGDKKSVEYRFAAVARDGYLCELEPNTKYTISLIPVTISGTTPETFYLHNVLTLPAVASLAVSNLQDSVDNSAEAEITDSTEGTDEVSTEGRKTATLSNSPSLSENITGAIPTVPSESNEKVNNDMLVGQVAISRDKNKRQKVESGPLKFT